MVINEKRYLLTKMSQLYNEKIKLAINGFGRIGRCILRAYIARRAGNLDDHLEIKVINLGKGDTETYSHLLQYDSTHSFLPDVTSGENFINTNLGKIKTLNITDSDQLNWSAHDVDVVLECTGSMTKAALNLAHIKAGAKKVIVSAPCDGAETIIYGVNNDKIDLNNLEIISVGSCTTNCLAPIVKVLHENIGVVSGFMTTIHAYTSDQNLLDARHRDLRRARAANMSMIPTSTGAAKSIGMILPDLKGKLDGVAIRVPVPNVSMVDLKFTSQAETSIEQINEIMKAAAKQGALKDILTINEKELVSIDFNHDSSSAIFDTTQTRVVNKTFCRIAAWYDNEWGFSNRMLDVCNLIMKI